MVKDSGGVTIRLETTRPMSDCVVLVLADLQRVHVRGISHRLDVLAMDGPIARLRGDWHLGEYVLVECWLR